MQCCITNDFIWNVFVRTTLLHRWVHEKEVPFLRVIKVSLLTRLLMPIIRKRMRIQAWHQGMGRHSREEVALICEKDLQALSDILGKLNI